MGHAQAQSSKTGMHLAACTLPPTHSMQIRWAQTQGQCLHRKRLMFWVALQPLGWSSANASSFRSDGHDAGRPHGRRRLHPDDILQQEFLQAVAKAIVVAVGGVSQHWSPWHLFFDQPPDLFQRYLRFALKADFLRHARHLSSLWVLRPDLRQIQPVGYRQTGLLGGQRYAYGYPAVLLLAQLPAILSRHTHRMRTLLRQSRSVDDPGGPRQMAGHRAQHPR